MEPKWAGTALVPDEPVASNQVNAIGPPGVFLFGAVTEIVDDGWEFDSQLADTHPCHLLAFPKTLGTGKNNFVADVTLHLPYIAGMSFEYVHGIELHA